MIYLLCILNTFIKSKQDSENLSISEDYSTSVHSNVREQEHLKEKTNIQGPNDTKSDENVKQG